jgi:hypothetical protein
MSARTAKRSKIISDEKQVNPQFLTSSLVSKPIYIKSLNQSLTNHTDRQHIGGSDDLAAAQRSGKLKKLLKEAPEKDEE